MCMAGLSGPMHGNVSGLSIDTLYLAHMLDAMRHLEEIFFANSKDTSRFKLQMRYIVASIPSKKDRDQILTEYLKKYEESKQASKDPDVAEYEAGFYAVGLAMDYLNHALHISKEDVIGMIDIDPKRPWGI